MSKPTFTSSLHYRDPKTALEWLERVFGFETVIAIEGPSTSPEMCHYEMAIDGQGRIMIGGEWAEFSKSPTSIGGANTQRVHVQLDRSVDDHYEKAKAAGAEIAQTPTDQFYGDRAYRAIDPEGHHWTFSQTVSEVSREEAEVALGLPIKATQWP